MSLARFEEGRIADMVRNVTFEEWEAEAMADPEVRAAVEALEPEYQRERARIAARLAASLKPRRSGKWRQCERCHGKCGVPEQTTLDGEPTGEMLLCPVCLGLGKVPAGIIGRDTAERAGVCD